MLHIKCLHIASRFAIVIGMDFTTNGDNKLPIESTLPLVVYGTIATALFFDFVNGFHDSANAIATVVGTEF